mmetsp:Transcript_5228/g.22235  ORF Transcript_5228/g.22235 Transcript_5228/m.22235 type:complete len:389 (-) Transcript_5228:61-1227(-)
MAARLRTKTPARPRPGARRPSAVVLDNLHHVLVVEEVVLAHLLRLVLDRGAPHPGELVLLDEGAVDAVAEVGDAGLAGVQDDGAVKVGDLALGLGVDAQHLAVLPNALLELVEVPGGAGADGDKVPVGAEQLDLGEGQGVDLVENVDDGHVHGAVADSVNDLVHGAVGEADLDVGVGNLVLAAHRAHDVVVDVTLGVQGAEGDAAAVLLVEADLGLDLVHAHAKALQLVLELLLQGDGLGRVQHDEEHVAGPGRGNDLATATLAVLGALDDTRQIHDLKLRAAVKEVSRNGSKRRELVRRRQTLRAGELAQQRALAHGGKTNQPHTRVARLGHVKAFASPATATLAAGDELRLQLRQLRLQQPQMLRRGLVLLGLGHLGLDVFDLLLG